MTDAPDGRRAVRLLIAPYDSGHADTRMGAGPTALDRAGAVDRLRARGHVVRAQVLAPSPGWQAELATAFELDRLVADAVARSRASEEVPVLLAGNCNTTLGVLAGLSGPGRRIGLLWLDAHGDFNTPDEDTSGFLDGQGLAIVVGRCWRALAARVPGFTPLPERDVVLVGARDLSSAQVDVLERSDLTWLRPEQARRPADVAAALDDLAGRVDAVHFHVDLDVHDPSIAPANGYAAPDGLSAADVVRVLDLAAARVPVVSATLASYDPAHDVEGRMRETALALLEAVADRATPLSTV
ncbi:MAG TPA: arginase family protein [Blastococcus sp.]|jgi:arginase|nr:arginase family protein [Blastococcus sp.]